MTHPVKGFPEVYKVVEQVSLMLKVFLHQYAAVEDLLYRAPACPKSSLFFSQVFLCFFLQSVENDSQQNLAGVADEADCSIVLAPA